MYNASGEVWRGRYYGLNHQISKTDMGGRKSKMPKLSS